MKICTLILFLQYQVITLAQTKIDTSGLRNLNTILANWNTDPALIHGEWAFCIMEPKTGKILAQHNAEKSLMPASSMKVVTTISALSMLGENYRYTTTIEYSGTITKDSTLNGDLIIHGSGDPTLGSSRIAGDMRYDTLVNDWAQKIKAKGINKITGKIIADASTFEDYATPGSWNWDDIGQYYGAGASGLNVYENTYTLYYSSTKTTTHIDSVFPLISGLTFFNDVTVKPGSDNAYIYGAPDNYYRYVVGTIPPNKNNYPVDGSMPDPPLFIADALKQALITQGVSVEQQSVTVYALKHSGEKIPTDRKILFAHKSAPLYQLIDETNLHSINLYAETFLKTLGKEQLGDGSRESGIKVIKNYWDAKGFDLSGLNQEDGSGLSRINVISPEVMCSMLCWQHNQTNFSVFKNSLPVSAESGTLKSITGGTSAAGNIIAKSGSMYKVRSYSGYVKTHSGDLLAFCIIINNYTCSSAEIKSKLEKLMIKMAAL